MPSLKDLLDLLGASWPVLLALMFASMAILVGHQIDLEYLTSLPEFVPGIAFLTFVLSASVLLVSLIRGVTQLIMGSVWERKIAKVQLEHIRRLNDLPEPEAFLLGWAVANNTQVFSAPYFNEYVKALQAKGFVEIPGGHHHTDSTPFRIPDHVWIELKRQARDAPELHRMRGLRPFD